MNDVRLLNATLPLDSGGSWSPTDILDLAEADAAIALLERTRLLLSYSDHPMPEAELVVTIEPGRESTIRFEFTTWRAVRSRWVTLLEDPGPEQETPASVDAPAPVITDLPTDGRL